VRQWSESREVGGRGKRKEETDREEEHKQARRKCAGI
jgi:hypothetical protein